jgi:hypothetical protein
MPSPDQTTPDTPLRLSVVAALAFPEDPRRRLVCVTAPQESTERGPTLRAPTMTAAQAAAW